MLPRTLEGSAAERGEQGLGGLSETRVQDAALSHCPQAEGLSSERGQGRWEPVCGTTAFSPSPPTHLPVTVSLLNVSPPIFFSFCPLVCHNVQPVYINLNTQRKFYVLFGYILKWDTLK